MRSHLRRIIVVLTIALLALAVWLVLGFSPAGRDAARSPQQELVSWMPTVTDTVVNTATPTLTPSVTPQPTNTPTPEAPTATSTPSRTPTPTLAPSLVAVAREYRFDINGDFIIINQDAQRMYVVRQGQLLREIPISTGDPDQGYETPAWSGVVGAYWGTFLGVGNVYADNGWWLFKAPGGNILIHGLPYVVKDGHKVYKDAEYIGIYPASSGCIRLLVEDIEWFTALQPEGMPIVILPYTGGDTRAG
jgi:lipoprotein-anchoring transpeptidase ErfK/SrfK